MTILFVGPTLLSGIGQVMNKYAQLFNSEYIVFGNPVPNKKYTHVFTFLIPVRQQIEFVKTNYNPDIVMTICETDPVHEDYCLIFDNFPNVLVSSEFCKRIFKKQFGVDTYVLPLWCPIPKMVPKIPYEEPYTFYTIGNVIDQRKNIPMLIEAFIRLGFKNCRLLIKATCIKDVNWKIPGVEVINGLISDEDMEKIHAKCHCYINCSKSEGVGMGAVEAAVRNKPVIITDFGGLQEYVKTPFVVTCTETTVGNTDFLFQPHMRWGQPSLDDLMKHMKYCYENKIVTWDHTHTKDFTSGSVLRTKLSDFCTTLARSSV